MIAQVLVYPQSVERRGIEAGQEHVHHYEDVYLTVLHAQRHIFIIVGELVCRRVVVRREHLVIVRDGTLQEVTAALVHARCAVRVFILYITACFVIYSVREDCGYLQFPVLRQFCHLLLELIVIQFGCINALHGKHGVEAVEPCLHPYFLIAFFPVVLHYVCHIIQLLEDVRTCLFRLLCIMLQYIACDIADALC